MLNKTGFLLGNKGRILSLFLLTVLFASYLSHVFFCAGFYFDGSFDQHKQWFPKVYLFTALFFKSVVPVCFGGWLVLFVQQRFKFNLISLSGLLVFVAGTGFCLLLLNQWGFIAVSPYVFVLIALQVLTYLEMPIRNLLVWSGKRAKAKNYFITSIFFFGYILACLLVKDGFHPFYKFGMYNRIMEEQYVFTLKDPNGKLVPFDDYFTIGENGVYNLYRGVVQKSGATTADSVIIKQLWAEILQRKRESFDFDSLSLNKREFRFKNGKISTNEHQIYKDKVE